MDRRLRNLTLAGCLALGAACSPSQPREDVLAAVPLDSTDELITRSGVDVDREHSVDGHGSIRIHAAEPVTVRITELEGLSVEDARLVYRAHLRSEDLHGKAYLEMWCVFPGGREYFSRALQSPLSGTNDWVTQETPFLLESGQRPAMVKLNLVIDGAGTVWLDDITLLKVSR